MSLGALFLVSRFALRLGVIFSANASRCIGGVLTTRPGLINPPRLTGAGGKRHARQGILEHSISECDYERNACTMHRRGCLAVS